MNGTTGLRSVRRLRQGALAVSFLALATAAPALTPEVAQAATPRYSYQGSAYGTSVSVGSVVKSGSSAPLSLGCTANGNIHARNSSAALNQAPLVSTGAVATTADTYASPVRSRMTASTADVNLLSGRVRATTIKAASHTIRTTSGYAFSTSGTTFASLVVNGRAISATPAPNTRVTVPGFGYVTINEQVKRSNGLTVVGLRLVITTSNSLHIPVGSSVTVSHAMSALSGPVSGVLSGYGYGSRVDSGGTVTSGSSFTAYLPCLGTAGRVRTNTGAGVNLPGVATTGTITNTAAGTVNSTSAKGTTTSTVQTANVLNGLVEAKVIKASATAGRSGSSYSLSDSGTGFGSLKVKGRPDITADVRANTVVKLPEVGTLYLRRVDKRSNSVTVIMVQLVLTHKVNGLPAGTDIKIGVARTVVS